MLKMIPTDDVSEWEALRHRILLVGPPNSGKTASLETFLETDTERMVYIQMPGEQGAGTFPAQRLGDRAIVFIDKREDPTRTDWVAELASIHEVTIGVLTGKYGPVDVLAIDGLHKGHEVFLAKVTGGESAKTLDFDAKLYEDARKLMLSWLHMLFRGVTAGKIKRVVCTCWDGREKDDPDNLKANAPTHLFPDLPGKLAKGIVGEFGVVLGTSVEGTGGGARYRWQTAPYGKVGGVGIKAPKEVMANIKLYVPQDWRLLAPLLKGGTT